MCSEYSSGKKTGKLVSLDRNSMVLRFCFFLLFGYLIGCSPLISGKAACFSQFINSYIKFHLEISSCLTNIWASDCLIKLMFRINSE